MIGIIAVLCVVIVFLAGIMLKYRQQIKGICEQLSFMQGHDTNMLITTEMDLGGLGELTARLNMLLEQQRKERIGYKKKEQMIAETYTGLSHDIRTPLTSLDGYVQLLADSDSREEQERYYDIISERIDSLKEMLEELFLFTKLKNESYPLELVTCDLNRIVKDTIFSYYEDWKEKSVEPKIHLPEEACLIMGNRQALRRTLQNVIKNGLVHGDDKIQIQMELLKVTGQNTVVLSILNSISKKEREQLDVSRVFDRFYKADAGRNSGSTGLGLPIAKEFVLRMNGNIEAFVEDEMFGIRMEFPIINESEG